MAVGIARALKDVPQTKRQRIQAGCSADGDGAMTNFKKPPQLRPSAKQLLKDIESFEKANSAHDTDKARSRGRDLRRFRREIEAILKRYELTDKMAKRIKQLESSLEQIENLKRSGVAKGNDQTEWAEASLIRKLRAAEAEFIEL